MVLPDIIVTWPPLLALSALLLWGGHRQERKIRKITEEQNDVLRPGWRERVRRR